MSLAAVFSLQVGNTMGIRQGPLGYVVSYIVRMTSLSKTESVVFPDIYINVLSILVNYSCGVASMKQIVFFRNLACFHCISSAEQLHDFINFE